MESFFLWKNVLFRGREKIDRLEIEKQKRRMNMKKRLWTKLAACALAGTMAITGLTGCKSSDKKDSDSVDTVRIGTQEMPNDEGIAKAENYLEEKMGVKVKLVKFDSGKDINNALKANSIDFGLEGSTSTALALSTGIDVKLIWIHEVLGDIESLAVRKKDNIKSIADLKGKTIAVPFATTSHYCLLRYLESQGMSESDVKLLDMDTNSAYAAWKRGDIDAAWIWQPALQSVLDDGGEILVSNGDAAKEGYMTANVEVVSSDFAEKHPDLVKKYIEAVKNGKVFKEPLGVFHWFPPSGDAPLMANWMAQTLHLDLFIYSMSDEIKLYYENFCGYKLTQEQIEGILTSNTEAGKGAFFGDSK